MGCPHSGLLAAVFKSPSTSSLWIERHDPDIECSAYDSLTTASKAWKSSKHQMDAFHTTPSEVKQYYVYSSMLIQGDVRSNTNVFLRPFKILNTVPASSFQSFLVVSTSASFRFPPGTGPGGNAY